MSRASAMRRLFKEIQTLLVSPPEGVQLQISENDMTDVTAWLDGPSGTPYEGGRFRIHMLFGETYPQQPPLCTFQTKIFHSNVGPKGEICVNILKKDWDPAVCNVTHILATIRCLLIYPNAESALNEEAGKMLLENYADFAARARLMTSIHAQPQISAPKASMSPTKDSLRSQRSQVAPLGPTTSNVDKADVVIEEVQKASSTVLPSKVPVAAPKRKTLRRL